MVEFQGLINYNIAAFVKPLNNIININMYSKCMEIVQITYSGNIMWKTAVS